jgi:hypothetical protein
MMLNDVTFINLAMPLVGLGLLGKCRLHGIQRDDVRRCCDRAPCPPPFVIMALHHALPVRAALGETVDAADRTKSHA